MASEKRRQQWRRSQRKHRYGATWAKAMGPCIKCGAIENIEPHHPDKVHQPDFTVPLCNKHHSELHHRETNPAHTISMALIDARL